LTRARGWSGWDAYARFYDWENARTFGRRDVRFWQGVAAGETGAVLELGCGTGRLLFPLARVGRPVVGVDRSPAMLARARGRRARQRTAPRPALIRGDITALPCASATFGLVVAPYGMLQSLLSDADLDCALREMSRVLRPGGLAGIDLVPELPAWKEYHRKVRLRGRTAGGTMALVETVRQDPGRRETTFVEEFVLRRGRQAERQSFSLTFRTVEVRELVRRLIGVGLRVEATLGDYRGGPLEADSETWLLLARKS
jgi:ubiquinone/menaquinone biosynthesis C-methylase UbiE